MTWHKAKSIFEDLGRAPGETRESLRLLLRKRLFLGLAVGILALVLGSDAFLVGASGPRGTGAISLSQQIIASANTVYVRSVRLVDGLRTLYQVAHLDELELGSVQPVSAAPASQDGRVIPCNAPSTSFPSVNNTQITKSRT